MEEKANSKQYYIDGNCEKLLYKDINGYCIHVTDFSFVRDGIIFDVKIQNPGSDGKWFVFSINDKLFATNNVWVSEWADKIKKGGPIVSEVMIKKYLKKKPEDDAITCVGLSLLSKKKQKELINYVLKLNKIDIKSL